MRRAAAEGGGVHRHFGIAVGQHAQRVALGQAVRQLRAHTDGYGFDNADVRVHIFQSGSAQHVFEKLGQLPLGFHLVDAKQYVQRLVRRFHRFARDAHAQQRRDAFQLLERHRQHHQHAPARDQIGKLALRAQRQRVEAFDGHGFKIGSPGLIDRVTARIAQPFDTLFIAVHKRQMASRAGQYLRTEPAAHFARADDDRFSPRTHADPP